MKRICFVVVLLVLVLLSATAFAQKADKELCLTSKSDNSAVTSQNTHVLSYTGLSNGHVLFYGETCYVIPAANELPESTGCLPGSGSGILSNSKLEFFLQGAEYNTDFGVGVLETATFHALLSIDTLAGTYASEIVNYIGGQRQEIFDSGTIEAVKCPSVPKSEIDADKQFKKMVEQIDKLGTL